MFSFNPAISKDAAKRLRREIRSWRLHQRSGSTLEQLADEVNPVVRGWINYYGSFRPSELHFTLNRINDYLVGGSCRNTNDSTAAGPAPGRHWPRRPSTVPTCSRTGASPPCKPSRLDDGSRVTGDC